MFTKMSNSPGRVVQLDGALCQSAKVAGSVPAQGTYKNQPMSASINGTIN